jgi:hypothetical protein
LLKLITKNGYYEKRKLGEMTVMDLILKYLTAIDFVNHQNSTVEYGNLTVLFGDISQGKSAIGVDALSWTLAGAARKMKDVKDRQGELDLIREGAQKAVSRMLFEKDGKEHKIERSRTASVLNLFLDNKKPKNGQLEIWSLLGIEDGDQLRTVFKGNTFFSRNSEGRKELIYKLLGGRVARDMLLFLLQSYNINDRKLLQDEIIPKIREAGFKKARSWAVERRQEWGRIKNSQIDKPVDLLISLRDRKIYLSVVDTVDLKEQIEKFKQKRGELIEKTSDKAQDNKVVEIETQIMLKGQRRIELHGKEAGIKKKLGYWDKSGLVKTIEEFKKRKEDLIKENNFLKQNIIEFRTNISSLETQEKNLSKVQGKCTLCGKSLSDEAKAKLLEKIQNQLDTARSKLEEKTNTEKSQTNNLTEIENTLKERQGVLSEYEQNEQTLEKIQIEVEGIAKVIEELKKQKSIEVAKRKADDESSGSLLNQITKLDKAIEESQEVLRKASEYQEAAKKCHEQERKQYQATDMHALYDRLEKALAPDKIPSDIVRGEYQKLQTFVKEIGRHLYKDQEVTFDDNLIFYINGRGESKLGTSELLRLSWIIQIAFAKFANLRFLVLDSVEVVPGPYRAALLDLSAKLIMNKEFNNIVLILTNTGKLTPCHVQGINAKWYLVESGTVKQVNPSENAIYKPKLSENE